MVNNNIFSLWGKTLRNILGGILEFIEVCKQSNQEIL